MSDWRHGDSGKRSSSNSLRVAHVFDGKDDKIVATAQLRNTVDRREHPGLVEQAEHTLLAALHS